MAAMAQNSPNQPDRYQHLPRLIQKNVKPTSNWGVPPCGDPQQCNLYVGEYMPSSCHVMPVVYPA